MTYEPWLRYKEGFAYNSKGDAVIVDPPSGWKYGFPAPLQEDYRQQLLDAGYKEQDLEVCLKHSRYWPYVE